MRLSDPEKHFNYLRMTTIQFDGLLSLVGPELVKLHVSREPISPAERLSMCLRYLASGDSMVSISYAFRDSKQTVSSVINETCKVLSKVLKETVFMALTEQNWRRVAQEFGDLWQLPHCVGAVDGKHIIIQAPENCGSQFFNFKGSHSIVLMGVCDAKYKFIVVDFGAQGRQSDGGIFRLSQFGSRLLNSKLNFPTPSELEIGADSAPYYIVGDSAFPLTGNLMRPYPGSFIPQFKRIFNYRISRGRRVSENTFGIMASRWRILRRPIIASLDTVEAIVGAVVVLHNWLMGRADRQKYYPANFVDTENGNGTITNGEWRKESGWPEESELSQVGSNMYKRSAEKIRDDLAYYFYTEGSVAFQWDKYFI